MVYASPPQSVRFESFDQKSDPATKIKKKKKKKSLIFFQINFFSILPIYVLTALAEVLAFLSSMEYAYTKAPRSMKSLVASINLVLCAVGSALGLAVSPTSKKPQVLVQFACLSGIMFVVAVGFYWLFAKYNDEEVGMNQVEREGGDDDGE